MRFDLFYELSLPPQRGLSEPQAYAETLAQIELADRLGYGCAWLVEHHFLRGYSHCSKPELVLAAAASRTRNIRLGHAIIPLPLHHPIHVAERVATLDILSGGRLEVGIGRGFSPREYAAFGADMAASRELADESLEILRASFARRPVTYHGAHYRLDALDIGRYAAAWRGRDAPRIGMTVGVLCLEDRRRAQRLAAEAFAWFYRELFQAALPVLERLYPSYEELHELGRFRALMKLGVDFGLLETFGLAVAGDPEDCRAKLAKYAANGVTHLLCAFGAGAVEGSVARESLELFAREVMPAFAGAVSSQQSAISQQP